MSEWRATRECKEARRDGEGGGPSRGTLSATRTAKPRGPIIGTTCTLFERPADYEMDRFSPSRGFSFPLLPSPCPSFATFRPCSPCEFATQFATLSPLLLLASLLLAAHRRSNRNKASCGSVGGPCRPVRLMSVSRKSWRKGSSMRGDITVIVRFQNRSGLLFPNHRAVVLDSQKKAEETMVSMKSEGPRSVIHNNRQVGARENRLMECRRQAYQTVRYTRHRIPFSRIQCALRRDGYRRQIVTKLRGPGTFDEGQFPQKASRHYVGNLKVPVIGYGESR